MPYRIEIGKLIREQRIRKSFSQMDIAEMIGMSQSAYAKVENGTTAANFERLVKISSVLKVSIFDLLPRELHQFNEDLQLEEFNRMSMALVEMFNKVKDNRMKELENKLIAQELVNHELLRKLKVLTTTTKPFR